MEATQKLIRGVNQFLDRLVCISLLLILLYGGYALWDNYAIYKSAGLSNQITKFRPTPSNPTLLELQKINPDVCAWLTLDNTKIDYPVLHAADNSRYLSCDLYGKYALGGSIFLDYRNKADFTDSYSLLYGHHMDGGAMFGDLKKFEDTDFFNRHSSGTLIITGKTYQLEIYAVLHEDAYKSPMFDVSDEARLYAQLISYIKEAAVQYREIEITADSRILAMSTCASATANGRTVVVARMVAETDAGGR